MSSEEEQLVNSTNSLRALQPTSQSSAIPSKKTRRQPRNRRRRPIKNEILHLHPYVIMTSFICFVSGLLGVILLLNKPTLISGEDYLYNITDGGDVWPVIDYIVPAKKLTESDNDYQNRIVDAPFLTDRYDKPRVVEFYAPWCGHCQHYKPHYIELGKESKAITPNLDFFAVSCVAHSKLCQKFSVHGYPTLKFFSEHSDAAIEIKRQKLNAKNLHKDYVSKYSHLEDKGDSGNDTAVVQAHDNASNDQKVELPGVITKLSTEETQTKTTSPQSNIYIDAASSLTFALRTSIFMTNNALSPKQEEVLREWITLLSKTLPRKQNAMKDSLHQIESMLSNMDSIVKSEDNLLQILKQTKHDEKWTSSCKSGYTCGLWQLLHIVTIGLVHYNDSIFSGENSNIAISTMDTADKIRNYIEYYFTCDECRKNFIQMYEACQFNRCDRLSYNSETSNEWKQLALWLWETHNDVNVRLLHESRAEKGVESQITAIEEQNVRWPSTSDCPACWQEGGGWNEDVVYNFLDSFYWPHDENVFRQKNTAPLSEDDIQNYSYIITIGSVIILFGLVQLRRRRRQKSLKKDLFS